MIHLQDFPIEASEPKVQLPFYTKPGECPRKIETERSYKSFMKNFGLMNIIYQLKPWPNDSAW